MLDMTEGAAVTADPILIIGKTPLRNSFVTGGTAERKKKFQNEFLLSLPEVMRSEVLAQMQREGIEGVEVLERGLDEKRPVDVEEKKRVMHVLDEDNQQQRKRQSVMPRSSIMGKKAIFTGRDKKQQV
jgi:hypothetical protein